MIAVIHGKTSKQCQKTFREKRINEFKEEPPFLFMRNEGSGAKKKIKKRCSVFEDSPGACRSDEFRVPGQVAALNCRWTGLKFRLSFL